MNKKVDSTGTEFIINNKKYTIKRALPNRGQSTPAGFADDQEQPGSQVVIKVDEPGVCLAEGLAVEYDPLGSFDSSNAILKAKTAVAQVNGKQAVVSIQPSFKGDNIKSLSKYLYGMDRPPRNWTNTNEDSYHVDEINTNIGNMNPHMQDKLALAIFQRQLNGDESVHTGQFLVTTNDKGQVVNLAGVDLGAAGRFAVAREKDGDFDPLHTSKLYKQSSMQFNKDYVQYLLGVPEVSNRLLDLWAAAEVNKIVQLVGDEFDQQMRNLGILDGSIVNNSNTILNYDAKREVLIEYYKTLVKGVLSEKEVNIKVKDLSLETLYNTVKIELLTTTEARCSTLHNQALAMQKANVDEVSMSPASRYRRSVSSIRDSVRDSVSSATSSKDYSSDDDANTTSSESTHS